MRKPIVWIAVCSLAAAAWLARPSQRPSSPTTTAVSGKRTALSRVSHAPRSHAATPQMPPQDQRITALLADEQTVIDHDLRAQLVELARTQQLGFGPRAAGDEETTEQRAARRAHRDDFRRQVRAALAAMPAPTRAAMRRHRVDVVRLGRALATL
jgi:hypothetical protein